MFRLFNLVIIYYINQFKISIIKKWGMMMHALDLISCFEFCIMIYKLLNPFNDVNDVHALAY